MMLGAQGSAPGWPLNVLTGVIFVALVAIGLRLLRRSKAKAIKRMDAAMEKVARAVSDTVGEAGGEPSVRVVFHVYAVYAVHHGVLMRKIDVELPAAHADKLVAELYRANVRACWLGPGILLATTSEYRQQRRAIRRARERAAASASMYPDR